MHNNQQKTDSDGAVEIAGAGIAGLTAAIVLARAGRQVVVHEALALLRGRQVRHLPVVTSAGVLAGMISDRDLLRHLGGVSEEYRQLQRGGIDEPIAKLMNAPVLSASRDTDVRHIARLFVEQRIGALPIVSDGELEGIIARSDVLRAVMRHFVLELWA